MPSKVTLLRERGYFIAFSKLHVKSAGKNLLNLISVVNEFKTASNVKCPKDARFIELDLHYSAPKLGIVLLYHGAPNPSDDVDEEFSKDVFGRDHASPLCAIRVLKYTYARPAAPPTASAEVCHDHHFVKLFRETNLWQEGSK